MDKQLRRLKAIYEKYDASVEASPYFRFARMAAKAGLHANAVNIKQEISKGGLSFVPHDKDGPLVGQNNNGKLYGRPELDQAVVLINRQMKRSDDYNEDHYWIDLIDSRGNTLLRLNSRGEVVA